LARVATPSFQATPGLVKRRDILAWTALFGTPLCIAAVIGAVCGACYLGLPSGRLADLRRHPKELSVCDHCGAFIYLPEDKPALSSNTHSQTQTQKAPKTKSAQAKR
jgi:hypothetical protein